jgi:putative Ca2+/H+ antiporter (TMEM165/GDT1 family)
VRVNRCPVRISSGGRTVVPLPERGLMKILLPIFFSVLVAELGDKTQLATLLLATNSKERYLTESVEEC